MDDEYRDPRLERTMVSYPDELEQPYAPPARPGPPPRRRRRWKRWIRATISSVVLLGLIGGVGGYFYLSSRLQEIKRVDPQALTPSAGPMTVLLVGSDSRSDLAPGQESSFGSGTQVSGKRSDAIMILHADPGAGRAAVLSIPRDLYLPISGTGKSNRINTAYAGGPDRLISTINDNLGIPINHYVEVNFDGFRGIVDAIGGLNVHFPAPARDILAELSVPEAGCVHLSGAQGLAYVRSRHYESKENGRWRTDPTSDHGRIQRQQDFIRRMVKKALAVSIRSPVTANSLLVSVVDDLTIDEGLQTLDLVRLGNNFRSLGEGDLEMLTLPTDGARIGGASVLKAKEPEAQLTIARFLNPEPAQPAEPVDPASVTVQVLNGSGRKGEAAAASAELARRGFQPAGTGDATPTAVTTIRYRPGSEAKAQLVQGLVAGGAGLAPDPSLQGTDVLLVTGRTFSGIISASGPPPAAPAPPAPAAEPAEPNCPA
ncbi:MAG: LCP family protein [Actinomycetota bacterium]